MTCRYSGTEWLDVLYTSVRSTKGGVADAAHFLTIRRGQRITSENLRLRLRGVGESRLSMQMFELLIEWMQEKSEDHALEALHALNEQFGLRAVPANAEPTGDSISGLAGDALEVTHQTGELANAVIDAIADQRITNDEADRIVKEVHAGIRLLDRLKARALRMAGLGR